MAQLKATYKQILAISFPLILGNTAWTSIGVFDTIFVGNLGKTDLDAIGFVSIFYSVLFMMGFGFTRGTQILIARRMGEGNKHEVGNIIDNTIIALTALAMVFFFVIKYGSHYILSSMLTNQDIVVKCEEFLAYRVYGVVASFISCIFIAYYSGIGKTVTLFLSIVVMSLLNIFLNYVLVYGKFGMPAMGIGGAALASTIAEWTSVLILVSGTFIKKRKQEFGLFEFAKLDWSLIWEMTQISIPLMLQSLVGLAGWMFFFARIETVLGKDNLAISSIFRQLILFFSIPSWALGSTANTLISNLMGQNSFEEVKDAILKISLVSLAFAIFSCIILWLFPEFCIGKFTDDQSLVPRATPVLYVIFGVLCLLSFSNIAFNGVISLGDIYIALGIEIFVIIVYIVYFQYLFTIPGISLAAIWTAEWVYWSLILIGSLVFLRRRNLIFAQNKLAA